MANRTPSDSKQPGGAHDRRELPSSPSLGERSAEASSPPERGGAASTEGRTGSEGGLGSAERNKRQEQSRGGQMGPGGPGR